MRIKEEKSSISYSDTKEFFEKRADRYSEDNPYSVTMYQDGNPELVRRRNEVEIKKLIPKLKLDKSSKVLDVACGIGRWSDAIDIEISKYCGLDFSDGLIRIAIERNKKENRHFYVSRNEDLLKTLQINDEGIFNRVLLIGALIYMNDDDVIRTINAVEAACEKESIVCIREPIGLETRLTLKEEFSDELCEEYNAIYRTREEVLKLTETLIKKGFVLAEESFLFNDDNLNNRRETAQYYFIFTRE